MEKKASILLIANQVNGNLFTQFLEWLTIAHLSIIYLCNQCNSFVELFNQKKVQTLFNVFQVRSKAVPSRR